MTDEQTSGPRHGDANEQLMQRLADLEGELIRLRAGASPMGTTVGFDSVGHDEHSNSSLQAESLRTKGKAQKAVKAVLVNGEKETVETSPGGDGVDKTSMWTLLFDDTMRDDGARKCRMIHPRSYFSQVLLTLSTVALLYTAAVVPVVISFEWNQNDACEWGKLLNIDLTFDTFFICDVILTFLVAEIDAKGRLLDNWREVCWHYVTGSFLFDVTTAIPISYLELYVYYQCQDQSANGVPLDPSKWKFARLVKPLKFIRIMRVYRAFASIDITYNLEKLFHIPPMAFSLFRVVVGIFATTHIAACSFWLVKVLTNSQDEMEGFLTDHALPPDAPISQQYLLCTYFIITIFTTVGFGDISATNSYEQVACMVLMLTGAMVFGTLLSEVQSGVAELRKLVREKGHIIQDLKNFLRLQHVPRETQRHILNWAGFEVSVTQDQRVCANAMQRLTDDQRLEVYLHMYDTASQDIELFHLSHAARAEMLAHLWASAETVVFEQGKVLAGPSHRMQDMLVIAAGVVRVEEPSGNMVVELRQGDTVGMWALMGDTDACSPFGYPVVYVADTHLKAHKISRAAFKAVLARCPEGLVAEIQEKWEQHLHIKEHLELLSSDTVEFRRVIARWTVVVEKLRKRRLRPVASTTTATGNKLLQRRLHLHNTDSIGEEDPNSASAGQASLFKACKRAVAIGERKGKEGGGGDEHAIDEQGGDEPRGASDALASEVSVDSDAQQGAAFGGMQSVVDMLSDQTAEGGAPELIPLSEPGDVVVVPEVYGRREIPDTAGLTEGPIDAFSYFGLVSSAQSVCKTENEAKRVSWDPEQQEKTSPAVTSEGRAGSTAEGRGGGGEWAEEKSWLVKNMTRLERRVTTMDGNVEQMQEELARVAGVCDAILNAVGSGVKGPSRVASSGSVQSSTVLRGSDLQSLPARLPQLGSTSTSSLKLSRSASSSARGGQSSSVFKNVVGKIARRDNAPRRSETPARPVQLQRPQIRLADSASYGSAGEVAGMASNPESPETGPIDHSSAYSSGRSGMGSWAGRRSGQSEAGSSHFSRRSAGDSASFAV